MAPIGTKPVISCQVKVHEVEELSDNPSDDPPPEDLHQDALLPMVHDSLNQPEISNSSDIGSASFCQQVYHPQKSQTHYQGP